MEQVILKDVEGISRLSGTDENGNRWIQFETDYLAGQKAGKCDICKAEITSGWLCLDGGDEICDSHVVHSPPLAGTVIFNDRRKPGKGVTSVDVESWEVDQHGNLDEVVITIW